MTADETDVTKKMAESEVPESDSQTDVSENDIPETGDPADSADDSTDESPWELLEEGELSRVLEALLLVVDSPVSVETLASATQQPAERIAESLKRISEDFAERDSGIDLRETGGGWRMYTRARFAPYVERLLLDGARSKLTRAALETLAVVAYRQPVTGRGSARCAG